MIRISALLAVTCLALVMASVSVPTAARAGLTSPFSLALPKCPTMTAVKVDSTSARHRYSFQRVCDGIVQSDAEAAYDPSSGRASEKITDIAGTWTFASQWICPADPWIAPGPVACSGGKISTKGNTEYSHVAIRSSGGESDNSINVPLSAGDLSAQSRHVLAAQLANALKPVPQTPSKPAHGNLELLQQPLAKSADHSAVLKQAFADLTVIRIDGPTALSAGGSGTYAFIIGNVGNTAASLEVNILFAGVLGLTGQVVADSGLNCTSSPSSGKVNSNLHCSGGQLDAQRSATVTVQAIGQSPGNGSVIASINNSRSLQESDYGNNLGRRDVTVN